MSGDMQYKIMTNMDGTLAAIYVYFPNNILNGLYIRYHKKGCIEELTTRKNGLIHGRRLLYYPNSAKHMIQQFNNGVQHGPYYVFFPNGTLKERSTMINGKYHGLRELFYEHGGIKARENYENGVENGPIEDYHPNKQLKKIIPTKMGKPHGKVEEYYESGKLKSVCYVEDGIKKGTENEYDEQGIRIISNIYDYENQSITVSEFYKTGLLQRKYTTLKPDNKITYAEYYPSGAIKLTASAINDKWVGIMKKYDEHGNMTTSNHNRNKRKTPA